jgi:predicted NBD/HSP70 family sugar kinase
MKFIRPPITTQRLQRYHRWALLWLKWFVAFLEATAAYNPLSRQAEAAAHAWLDKFERLITNIIMLEAAERVRFLPPPSGPAQHRITTRAVRRAVLGKQVRRALRRRKAQARAEALRQDINPLIAAIARRLPRGLTRRAPVRTKPEAAAGLRRALLDAITHFSDSS